MTDEKKYCEVLKEIGQILTDKNSKIMMKDYEITRLKEKLEAAEKQLDELRKENRNALHIDDH